MKPFNNDNPRTGVIFGKDDYALHGDVVLNRDKSLPANFESMPKVADNCLAYGEATGHVHKLTSGDFDLRECPETKQKHLRVVTPTMLKHQEHCPIEIPPGNYRIGIQKEYDPFEKKISDVRD